MVITLLQECIAVRSRGNINAHDRPNWMALHVLKISPRWEIKRGALPVSIRVGLNALHHVLRRLAGGLNAGGLNAGGRLDTTKTKCTSIQSNCLVVGVCLLVAPPYELYDHYRSPPNPAKVWTLRELSPRGLTERTPRTLEYSGELSVARAPARGALAPTETS